MATPLNNSVVKAFRILNAFTLPGETLSLPEVTRRVGMNVATTHRFLITLEAVGAINRTPTGGFELGLMMADLGGRVSLVDVMQRATQPHVDALVEEFGEIIHVGVLDGEMVRYVAKGDGARSLTIITHVGKRLPLHCTGLGKALLSRQSPDFIRRYVAHSSFTGYTDYTITQPDNLLEELDAIRRRGFALDNEEMEIGLRCVAVPIVDRGGRALAAISLSAPFKRLDHEKIRLVAGSLTRQAAAIHAKLAALAPAAESP